MTWLLCCCSSCDVVACYYGVVVQFEWYDSSSPSHKEQGNNQQHVLPAADTTVLRGIFQSKDPLMRVRGFPRFSLKVPLFSSSKGYSRVKMTNNPVSGEPASYDSKTVTHQGRMMMRRRCPNGEAGLSNN